RRTEQRNTKASDELWNVYEIGEVGFVVDFFANALRRCRWFPAGIDDPEEGRIPLADCDWATPQLAADTAGLLDRIRTLDNGNSQAEVMAELGRNLKVAGAGNLYAAQGDLGESWQVLSTSAL